MFYRVILGRFWVIALGLVGLFVAGPACATNIMDTSMQTFQTQINTIQSTTVSYGTNLLIVLVTIQMGVSGIMTLLGNIELGELFKGLLVKNIMIMCLFYALIHGSTTYLNPIISTFTQMGQKATSTPTALTPSTIIDQGIDTVQLMFTSYAKAANTASGGSTGSTGSTGSSGFSVAAMASAAMTALTSNLLASLQMVMLAFLFFISFVGLAIGLALTTIQGYLWVAITPFLLGFGGLNFTRDMAITAMKGGFAIGMKIFLTYVIVGIASGLAAQIGTSLATMTLANPYPLWEAAATGLFFLVLAWSVPKMASDLMNGSASLSPGEAIGQAATVLAGAVGLGAAGAAAAGAAAKLGGSAVSGAGGLAKALGAGMDSAADHGKSGMAAAAHAMGEVGSHGMGLVKDAVGGTGSAFAQKVDSSVGGKLASSINSTRGGSMSGIPVPSSSEGSIPSPAASSGDSGASGGTGSSGAGGDGAGATPASSGAADTSSPAQSSASPAASSGDSGTSGGTGNSGAGGAGATPAASSSDSGASGGAGGDGATPRAATSSPAQSSASTGIPVPSDASGASISGGSNPVKPPQPGKLAQVQQGLQNFASQMPQDGHTVGVNANISHSAE